MSLDEALPAEDEPGRNVGSQGASSNGLLSDRERGILRWISFGASNKVVAQRLGTSPSMVRAHVESVLRKLESSTRAATTLKATWLGLYSRCWFRPQRIGPCAAQY